jgi:hypothetical protein
MRRTRCEDNAVRGESLSINDDDDVTQLPAEKVRLRARVQIDAKR